MIYAYMNFHLSSSNDSLITGINCKAKYYIAANFLFYILHKITFAEVARVLKVYYHMKIKDPTLSGSSASLNSKVHMATMLLLLMTGN
jgi:hypothetical protein